MEFAKLAKYLQRLEETSSRNAKIALLAQVLREAEGAEVDKICYLALGRLAPPFAAVEFQLAEKMMVKVLAQAFGRKEEEVAREMKEVGDLGEVGQRLAARINADQNADKRSVLDVYKRLYEVAIEAGEKSQERKIKKMAELLNSLDVLSVRYVVRIPLGRLRLGFLDLTILDSLSVMLAGDKSLREKIEEAYNVRADIGEIARGLRGERGLRGIEGIKPKLGTPVMPALCQRLPTAEKMIEKVGGPAYAKATAGKVAVEPKYDGTRLQVHLAGDGSCRSAAPGPFRQVTTLGPLPRGSPPSRHPSPAERVSIFTRNLENVTAMFPDIARAIKKEVRVKEVILDGEAIGFDRKTGRFLAFQETMKRKRKYEVREKAEEIPLKYFVFDILYKNGESLLAKPFFERRKILVETIPAGNQTIILSPQIVTESAASLREFHDEQIKKGLEGVVVKKLGAAYDPGRRGYTWVKFKEEMSKKGGGLADTLDCLVMGYYKGRGKRTKFGVGAFLVGVRGSGKSGKLGRSGMPKGDFVTISKIGTGLTDEQWRELKVRGSRFEVRGQPEEYEVDKNLTPDVWVEPGLVVEIQADNITVSPIHSAGYALRFPRLVRFRDDKGPNQVSTLAEVEKLYQG